MRIEMRRRSNFSRLGRTLLSLAVFAALFAGCSGCSDDGKGDSGSGATARPAATGSLVAQYPRPDRVPAGDRQRRRLRRQQVRQPGRAEAQRPQGDLALHDEEQPARRATRRHRPRLPRRPCLLRRDRRLSGLGRAANGHVDWLRDLHAHLESSPLVVGDTLYVGTDTAKLLAIDIADGSVRWSFSAPGRSNRAPPTTTGGSSSPTIRGRPTHSTPPPARRSGAPTRHTVYTSSFKTRKTVGIDVRNRRRVFFLHQAGYTPMVSDGPHLYLIGYYTVFALEPTKPQAQ